MEFPDRPLIKLIAANNLTHEQLVNGFGDVVIRTFTNLIGVTQIDLDQLIASLVDALGLALAAKPGSSDENIRAIVASQISTDIFICMTCLHVNENSDTLIKFKSICK